MQALAWIEQTPLSAFIREDFYAYLVLLIFHALGMAFLVGPGTAFSLRVLGAASGVPLHRLSALFPVMWIGTAMAVPSGVLLLAGYPAKALTNWIFPVKLACLAAAAWLVWRIAREAFAASLRGEVVPPSTRWMAAAAIALWLAGVAGGKLLLYTNVMLLTSD